MLDIKVIAPAGSCTPDDFAVVALPKSGPRSPRDLAGKTIAVGLVDSIWRWPEETWTQSARSSRF